MSEMQKRFIEDKAEIIKHYENKMHDYSLLREDCKKIEGIQAENREFKIILESYHSRDSPKKVMDREVSC